jgi:magnesium-transporting ATPase (P-type)
VGLEVRRVVLGHELAAMDATVRAAAAEEADVFAKLAPAQKAEVIAAAAGAGPRGRVHRRRHQ